MYVYIYVCIYIYRFHEKWQLTTRENYSNCTTQQYIYIYTCIYVYMYIYTYMYKHINMHTYINLHIYIYICIYVCCPATNCTSNKLYRSIKHKHLLNPHMAIYQHDTHTYTHYTCPDVYRVSHDHLLVTPPLPHHYHHFLHHPYLVSRNPESPPQQIPAPGLPPRRHPAQWGPMSKENKICRK